MLAKLAPFGEGNPKPIFLFKGAEIVGVRNFGRDGSHLELLLRAPNGTRVSAINFFTKPDQFSRTLEEGRTIDLIASLEKSTFKRLPELRLRIVDIL